jgi:ADP-ribose pyrophosphatase YjhB (NUDIX family)
MQPSRAQTSKEPLPDKAGAVILRERKLLLVGDEETPFFWMPGGKLNFGEDDLKCLERELREELGVTLTAANYLLSATFLHEKAQRMQTIRYYHCAIRGDPQPQSEITKRHWLTRAEYDAGYAMTNVCRTKCVPHLIEHGLF